MGALGMQRGHWDGNDGTGSAVRASPYASVSPVQSRKQVTLTCLLFCVQGVPLTVMLTGLAMPNAKEMPLPISPLNGKKSMLITGAMPTECSCIKLI